MHGRPELKDVATRVGELRISGVKGIDSGRACEKDELRAHGGRFLIGCGDRLRSSRHLAHRKHLRPVPTELGSHRRAKQLTCLGLQTLCGDDKRAQRMELQQLDHRAHLPANLLGVRDELARNRDGSDLAPGHLLALRNRLAVHEGEDGDVAERVDGVDQVRTHPQESAVRRDQTGLALNEGPGFEPWACNRGGQALCRSVFVDIALFQLHDVNGSRLPDLLEMFAAQYRALAQPRAEVMDQNAADHVLEPCIRPLQPVCPHYWQHRFGLQPVDPIRTGPTRAKRVVVRLYNTFTRTKEDLTPTRAGVVRIYSCGPTVYRYVHIGNLRTFMLPDLLCRSLEYLGYQTEQVMNITDVGHLTDDDFDRGEDKMLVSARLESKSPEEISEYYTRAFKDDAARLNIRPAAHYPQATHYIPQMVDLIAKLIAKGHAYDVGGTVYYDIASFPAYGKLSRNTTDKLLAGARGEVDPRKRNPGDFTLWKGAGEHRLQVWPSPWGPGFPGWHIECSAMSMSQLGERFDIHTGGADNVFPHHEAEIAQSEGATGHRVVGCWVHGGLLMFGGSRMAKSAGNFFRITDLVEQGFDPLAFRYLALQAKYRTKLSFSTEGVAGAVRALRSLRQRVADWAGNPGTFDAEDADVAGLEARFRSAIADDLDLPAAMALVAELPRSAVAPSAKAALLLGWDRVLGLDLDRPVHNEALPDGAAALLEAREKAREAKDFAESDRLRQELAANGVAVTDTPEGQRWKVLATKK